MIERLDADGPAAPPRSNGEVVFDEPWQSRAFGVAVSLADSGSLEWRDFQAALIRSVEAAMANGDDSGIPSVYWSCWLDALGSVVGATISASTWSARCGELADRPAGHDH